MSRKKTRNRQLAKVHQRHVAERRQQQRRRGTTIAVALIVGFLGLALVFFAFIRGGDEETPAAASPSATPSEVACGGDVPKGADQPKPQFDAPEDVLERGKSYTATLQTSCGDIVIELLTEQAPETVNSFVFLAEQGYFDGQRFHRLDTSIDVIQGGDPTGTGSGSPGYTIPDELTGEERYGPGVVAMANGGPDTGGSQFFIVTGSDGHLLDDQGAWTIFGNVVEGLDVAQQIQELPIQNPEAAAAGDLTGQQPAQPVYVEKVTIDSQ